MFIVLTMSLAALFKMAHNQPIGYFRAFSVFSVLRVVGITEVSDLAPPVKKPTV